ncbi:MAG: carbon-nitrogen hydrolase family protein [Gemmatimonadota bacterium]|nr:carbon-nitrogen hydrolase family protein [Gemmatimonadota bacterium]
MPRRWLRVAAVQMHADDNVERNVRNIVDRLNTGARERVDVAAFHEGVLFGYCDRPDFWSNLDRSRIENAERQIVRACRENGIAAVVGSTHQDNGNRYNSLLVVDRDGTVRGRYGKIHLAGEQWFEPSQHLPIYSLCGVPCCFLICHDIRYPELVRLPAAAGAKVCFFCSCESSVTNEHKLSAYRAMPISRATENGIYVVMANAPADRTDIDRAGSSHGESKIIHPDGNVIVEAGMFSDEIVIRRLDLHEASRNIAMRAVNDVTCISGWMKEGVSFVDRGGA